MSVTGDFAEAHKLAADFGAAGARVSYRAAQEVRKAVDEGVRVAQEFAPEGETGDLSDSITSTVRGTYAEFGPDVVYAPFVEYGTVYQRSHPFMWPASDLTERKFDKAMDAITRGIL